MGIQMDVFMPFFVVVVAVLAFRFTCSCCEPKPTTATNISELYFKLGGGQALDTQMVDFQ